MDEAHRNDVQPAGESPNKSHQQRLLEGSPLQFRDADSDETRTIKAEWLVEAIASGVPISVEQAIIDGILSLKYGDVRVELQFINCKFRRIVDCSYATFKRNVILSGTVFDEGCIFDSATFLNDLFMGGIKATGEVSMLDFIDAKVGGSLFCDGADFECEVRCQNLRVGNLASFRNTRFRKKADFIGFTSENHTSFGSNPSNNIAAAEFNAEVCFDDAHIGGHFDLEEVKFNDISVAASFSALRVEGDLMLSGAVISSEVSFVHSHVVGQGQFFGTNFARQSKFSGMVVERSLLFCPNVERNLPAASFDSPPQFHDLKVGSNADFSKVKIRGDETDKELHFDRARIANNLRFRRADIGTKLILFNTHVGGQWMCDDAVFEQDCKFGGMEVGGVAFFRNATFQSDVSFNTVHFQSLVRFEGLLFKKAVSFIATKADGDVKFGCDEEDAPPPARFEGSVDFTDALFCGNAEFRGVEFLGDADFDSARVEKSFFLQRSRFNKDARFAGLRVGQDLVMDECQLGASQPQRLEALDKDLSNKEEHTDAICDANFQAAEIRGDARFAGVVFISDTSFEDATFHGGSYFDSAVFHVGSVPSFSGTHFKHGAFFRRTIFHDVCNFRVARFELEARFHGTRFHRRAIFDGSLFDGIAEFRGGEHKHKTLTGAVFNDVSFEHAHFEQDARFDDALFRKLAGFRETSFKALYLSETGSVGARRRNQFRQGVDLRGCCYDRIQANWESLLKLDWQPLQSFVERLRGYRVLRRSRSRQQPYDRHPYIQIEKALNNSGRVEQASQVYLERRRVECSIRRRSGQYGLWFTDLLFGSVARYGVRPFRLVGMSVLLVVIGAWFFAKPGTLVQAKDAQAARAGQTPSEYEPTEVSLHQFLPVDIPMGSEWTPSALPVVVEYDPSPWTMRQLRRIHLIQIAGILSFRIRPTTVATILLRIPGWILVPLGVAALAGILRRSPE